MALESGLAFQMTSPVTEATYGVSPTLSSAKFFTTPSESLKGTKTAVQGQSLFPGKLYGQAARRVIPAWAAGGQLPMEVPVRGLEQWLYPMFGSYGQTLAALTQIGSTGAYTAVHAPGPLAGSSFALQLGKPTADGTVEPFTYVGCKISEWELSCARKELAKLNLTIVARNELAGAGNGDPLNVSVPTLQAYSAPPVGGVFHFAQMSIYTGGTCTTSAGLTTVASPVLAGNVLSASVKQTAPLDVDRYFAGNAGFITEPLDNGLRQGTGSFEVEWLSSESRYNAYAADTPTAFEMTFVGTTVIGSASSHPTLTILLPEIFFDEASPMVGGPEVVHETVPFTFLDDGTNNVIQATYITLDTT